MLESLMIISVVKEQTTYGICSYDDTRKAMELVRKGRSFFITGKADTGKTTLLKKIVAECRANGKNIAVTAPTGVAAKNAEGNHLFLHIAH